MADRVSQIAAQLLDSSASNARVSQLAASVIADDDPAASVSQLAAGVLADGDPRVRASQLAAFVLWESANARISQLCAQIVVDDDPRIRATQLCALVLFDYPTPPSPCFTMSDLVFPTLPGLKWDIVKTPQFATAISKHVSGREVRASNYAYPLWKWEMSYEFLRETAGFAELETLAGFFLARHGAFDTFLFADPSEPNSVAGYSVGTGDGLTTSFQLTKTYAGFAEPIGYVDQTTLGVSVGGVMQASGWSLIMPNTIVFITAPAAGAAITASYTWYYRVRFADDAHDYNNFMYQLWELKKLTLEMVKP